MIKNIILAILIAVVLTYSLGHVAIDWFDMHLSLASHELESVTAVLSITALVAVLVVIGFVIAFSLFAAIALAIFAVAIGIFFAGLSVFWPVILFTIIILLLVRDKKTPAY